MQRNRKSALDIDRLGGALRQRRKELGLTLSDLAKALHVDVGQLSRFERSEFKLLSKNLRKVIEYLQISMPEESEDREDVVQQFSELLTRSNRHKAAATALVRALQELQ